LETLKTGSLLEVSGHCARFGTLSVELRRRRTGKETNSGGKSSNC